MSPFLVLALTAAVALVATALLTPVVRGAAISMGLVRQAQEDRWHRRPTPAIGGVAIYAGFGLAMGVGMLLDPQLLGGLRQPAERALLPWTPWEGLLAGATLAFLVGLVDDFVHLGPVAKLAGQIAAATLLLLSGIGVWLTGQYLVDAALSILWFVAITNALNLLDNMDGLAAGVAAIAGAYLALIFVLDGRASFAMLALAFTAAVVGFLLHNYPPARIFMGDGGSHFLGLFLAGLALSPGEGLSRSLLAIVAVPGLVLAIPILDTALVTVGRVLENRPITRGGKDHTSHRLVDLGISEERAVWVLWTLAAVGGAVGVLFRTAERGTAALLGGVLVTGLVLMGAYVLSVRFRALGRQGSTRALYRTALALHERYPVLVLLLDAMLVGLAYYAAYVIRWEPSQLGAELSYFRASVSVVVATKLLALTATGVYGLHWAHFSMEDGLRLLRGSLAGTLAAAAALLLVERTGLSRGVLAIDFLTCSVLLLGARLSFRFMEGAARQWSQVGVRAVVLGPLEQIGLVRRALVLAVPAGAKPQLRAVAVADPDFGQLRGRVGGLRLYGGEPALENAIRETGATAVVLVEAGEEGRERLLDDYLARHGAVDVYRLLVRVERVEPATLESFPGPRSP